MNNVMLDKIKLIKSTIRTIENWPEAGVRFRDISTLLQNPKALKTVVEVFVDRYKNQKICHYCHRWKIKNKTWYLSEHQINRIDDIDYQYETYDISPVD